MVYPIRNLSYDFIIKHVNERMHIQGCQFEVNADDENISPVDNSEISIDAENPWENFILNFPEDVSL